MSTLIAEPSTSSFLPPGCAEASRDAARCWNETTAETLVAIIRDEPPPLSQAAPQAPAPVRWIVERCLAKDPEERYASTKDLRRQVRIHSTRRQGRLVENRIENGNRAVSLKGQSARGQLVQDDPEAEEIAPSIHVSTERLLRRHVRHCSERCPRAGQILLGDARQQLRHVDAAGGFGLPVDLRQSKVQNLGASTIGRRHPSLEAGASSSPPPKASTRWPNSKPSRHPLSDLASLRGALPREHLGKDPEHFLPRRETHSPQPTNEA